MTICYLSRPGRSGEDDLLARTPEVAPLRQKAILLAGLGCVGAPSALEFARAGIRELRLLDHDFVDPATAGRWPFGLSAAGLQKVFVIRDAIHREWPSTEVIPYAHRIGAVRSARTNTPSDLDVMQTMIEGVDLIYDASAELGVQHYLSEVASDLHIPYIAVTGTQGGWGGVVLRKTPDTIGCWMCYRLSCADGTIDQPPFDPRDEVQPVGCGDPTFAGAGFDLAEVAFNGVRIAVSTLCAGQEGGYPEVDFDVLTIAFRDASGRIVPPIFTSHKLVKHPQCHQCNTK